MANTWGSADFKQLKALSERIQKMQNDMDRFYESAAKELAARLLSLVVPRTPVGQYSSETGKLGGTLRRGWTAGSVVSPAEYAQSIPVEKNGNQYTITVINPVEYASYVEFGHRQTPGRYVPAIGKRLKNGWVEGQYMLTLSEKDLEKMMPSLLQKKLEKFLKEATNG